MYSQSSSFDEAEVNLQSDIDNLIKWFTTNKLHVNVSKSSCMSFTTRNNIRELNITINGNALKVENDVKYFGVHINDNLSWNIHIANVCKRLGHGFQILRKLSNVIPVNDMLTIYKTLIQPHIDYCITTLYRDMPTNVTAKEFNDYKIQYLDLLQISLDGTLAHGIFWMILMYIM